VRRDADLDRTRCELPVPDEIKLIAPQVFGAKLLGRAMEVLGKLLDGTKITANRAKALSVGLSNAYFRSLGLPSLFEHC
jgi:hypothetical protein